MLGETIKSDVLTYLGNPLATESRMDGSEVWKYSFYSAKEHLLHLRLGPARVDADEKKVNVTFGNDGVVKECIYITATSRDAQWGSVDDNASMTRSRCQDVR